MTAHQSIGGGRSNAPTAGAVPRRVRRGIGRWIGPGIITTLLGAGTAVLAIGLATPDHHTAAPAQVLPPAPPAQLLTAAPATTAAGQRATVAQLPASAPVSLDIPAIGVHSSLLNLGLNPDRTVQVPPLERDSKAGWYRYSPTPGQVGPSVILGHVDSAAYGPGVFFKLGDLKPGDTVDILRKDGRTATFRVDRIRRYPKNAFPTSDVYGNVTRPELRLITCGGSFDSDAGSYRDNIVVYASLSA